MANQWQVQRLKLEVTGWNTWRKKHPKIRPDLREASLNGADLHGADLNHANLKCANLTGADLSGVDLNHANLEYANLSGANLNHTNLCGANLSGAELRKADLSSANLEQADLSYAKVSDANLEQADLNGAKLCVSHLDGANLSYANLSNTDLRSADLSDANLKQANLHSADLHKAYLHSADLLGANLNDAKLSHANLSNADLVVTNLSHVNLSHANLHGATLMTADLSHADLSFTDLAFANLHTATLSGADLSHASFSETTISQVDLSKTKGLAEIVHDGPSIIQLHDVQLPQDGSALHFLRGAGVPDEWINFWQMTTMHPIQYHSLFISYSSKDDTLARRLHNDLQAHGVRCWFAPEDMKIGDKIRQRIDEAIHLQEKLLLLLSEHAIASSWVEQEVEAAMEKEDRQQREVLFPIRLDDSVMQTPKAWAATLRRTRHIGDFTIWTDPQAYQSAFERLLHDLRQN